MLRSIAVVVATAALTATAFANDRVAYFPVQPSSREICSGE